MDKNVKQDLWVKALGDYFKTLAKGYDVEIVLP